MTKGFRVVGILGMALAIAHCGDSDVRVSTGPGFVPAPGPFNGTLSDGGSIRIEVGSIEEVSFDCDDERIQETFTPPRDIESDGTFNIGFSDGGREFRINGTFRDDNTVDGEINDEDNECDVSYDAFRGGPGQTATPARTPTGVGPTPTGGGGPTATAGGGPTATSGGGPTVTPGPGATFTPGGGGATSTPGGGATATPGPQGSPCPVAVEVIGNSGSSKVLDTGWSGLAHNQTVIQDGKLTLTVSGCDNAVRPCGVCDVGGPIQNLNADAGDINARRCTNDTSIKCTDNAGCTSPGTCAFYFGSSLPLSAGGVSTCVTNQVNGAVTGTANVETGTFESQLTLRSRVYNAIETAVPCPICVGDGSVNDGTKGGTCSGGAKNGQACDGNGRSTVPSFGTTSLDCPPNPGALIATLPIDLDGSSGTETIALTDSSPGCTGAAGKKCFCPAEGQTTKPNGCIDTTDTAGDDSLCAASGSATEGRCPQTIYQHCAIQDFLGCLADTDCPQSGDTCVTEPLPCFLDNGVVGGSVTAIGMADPPTNGESDPTLAALFCVGRTSAAAVNAAGGLPGLGRIELPLHSKEILTLP